MEGSAVSMDSMDLKVTELLKEVQLDYSPTVSRFIDETVSAIKESIDKIPEDLQASADAAPGFIRDVGADKVEFTFKKPTCIEISGSYSIRSVAKPNVNVDLFIRMPKECFHEKDYLNHRYHAKRCLYLCIIKNQLTSSSHFRKIEWSTFQNEARKPVLIVYPGALIEKILDGLIIDSILTKRMVFLFQKTDDNCYNLIVEELVELPGFFVRMIPTATSLFNVTKLNLSRNNVRALNQEGQNVPKATPKYNNSILEDMFLEDNSEFVRRTFIGWKELGEALLLLKVWAHHRSTIYAHDCLNGFLISFIMSYLAMESGGNRINRSMKARQIFRVTLDFIATSKLWEKGLLLQHQGRPSMSKEDRSQYLQLFPVVVCDSSAHFNTTFRLTRSGFLELQDEASLTLNCMDKCRDGGFEEVFMTKIDLPVKYDYCIRLNLKGRSEVYASGFCLDDECWRVYEGKVHSLLEQGLSDRAKVIRVTWRSTPPDWTMEEGFSKFDGEPLVVGILISNPEKSFRVIDVGPHAENKEEVLKFRRFWGEKAELRRFKDGTIAESTVWECKQWERHLIIKRITEFVLLRHLALSNENTVHFVDQLDFSLLHGVQDPISCSGNLLAAYEVLAKRLRALEDIPLKISSVQALDSAFRFTSVFPPELHPLANERVVAKKLPKLTSTCIQPLEVMIQLEGSGNWPMDDVAIEKTKSAFLLKIGESLQSKWDMTCIATEDEVDVLMSGYAFRLRILHERGLSLLKTQVGNDKMKRISSIDKELFIQSQHSSMINGLQGRYPTYGPVVRLAKRWVGSHLFSACLAAEAIELLVAYLFLKPLPLNAPSSRLTGFLRFLRLLSDYDWTFSPLVVDINSDFSLEDEKEINEKFMLSRKSYEKNSKNVEPALFLATAYDKASEAWTKCSPNTSELKRMMAYARSSADLLTNLVLHDQINSHRWECLFRTPLNNYNAIILLHRDRLPYPQRLLFPSDVEQGSCVAQGNASKNFYPYMLPGNMHGSLVEMKNKLLVNFDPVRCFVEDMKREFSDALKVWYDSLGGDAIGLTWERQCSKKRSREEVENEEQDPVDMLKDVGKVGKGFVRKVCYLKATKFRS